MVTDSPSNISHNCLELKSKYQNFQKNIHKKPKKKGALIGPEGVPGIFYKKKTKNNLKIAQNLFFDWNPSIFVT